MATYYVRPDGLDTNTGAGPLATQAWQTLAKVVSTVAAGDRVHIAPGAYAGQVFSNILGVQILGDPLCLEFPDVVPGVVNVGSLEFLHNTASAESVAATMVRDVEGQVLLTLDTNGLQDGAMLLVENCRLIAAGASALAATGKRPVYGVGLASVIARNCVLVGSYNGAYISSSHISSYAGASLELIDCSFAGNTGGDIGTYAANYGRISHREISCWLGGGNLPAPADFERVGASYMSLETTAPISGTRSGKLVVAGTGRAVLSRARFESGQAKGATLKIQKSWAGGKVLVRLGGPGGSQAAASDVTTVQTLTVPAFTAPKKGLFPLEIWAYSPLNAEHSVLIDDVQIA